MGIYFMVTTLAGKTHAYCMCIRKNIIATMGLNHGVSV